MYLQMRWSFNVIQPIFVLIINDTLLAEYQQIQIL